jgi:hypothetical protein
MNGARDAAHEIVLGLVEQQRNVNHGAKKVRRMEKDGFGQRINLRR